MTNWNAHDARTSRLAPKVEAALIRALSADRAMNALRHKPSCPCDACRVQRWATKRRLAKDYADTLAAGTSSPTRRSAPGPGAERDSPPHRRPRRCRLRRLVPATRPRAPHPDRGDPMTETMSAQREAIVRREMADTTYAGTWHIRENETGERLVWEVTHNGTVLATLPDWAGNLALWIADARDDVPQLLALVTQLRAENAELAAELSIRDGQVVDLDERLAEAEHSLDTGTSDEQAGAPV